MAISKFIRAIQAGECITLFGDGSSRRDYTYVDDAVSSVLAALDVPQALAVLNVGGGRPVTLDQLVADIGEATGKTVLSERTGVQRGDVSMTWADPTRIAATLGWKAETTLVEGLRRTAAAMT
jgi:UDP-glucuronate 4-epimerase